MSTPDAAIDVPVVATTSATIATTMAGLGRPGLNRRSKARAFIFDISLVGIPAPAPRCPSTASCRSHPVMREALRPLAAWMVPTSPPVSSRSHRGRSTQARKMPSLDSKHPW
jgi:hypothetical protein